MDRERAQKGLKASFRGAARPNPRGSLRRGDEGEDLEIDEVFRSSPSTIMKSIDHAFAFSTSLSIRPVIMHHIILSSNTKDHSGYLKVAGRFFSTAK